MGIVGFEKRGFETEFERRRRRGRRRVLGKGLRRESGRERKQLHFRQVEEELEWSSCFAAVKGSVLCAIGYG